VKFSAAGEKRRHLIAPALGGFFASDAKVRLTAWGATEAEALANLVSARRAFPKGTTPLGSGTYAGRHA
jgi:hypothetical protein